MADYHAGHPTVLPKPYFQELTVEKGGAGTWSGMQASVKVMGKSYPLHYVVGEPEPGCVLQESDLDKPGEFTRFTFEPPVQVPSPQTDDWR